MNKRYLLLCTLALGCADLDSGEVALDTAETTAQLGPIIKPPTFNFPTPNRLLWVDVNGRAKVQLYTGLLGLQKEFSYAQPWPHTAIGVAGDRLLWSDGFTGASLWQLDDDGAVTSQITLSSPVAGKFFPASLALAPLSLNECWRRDDEQKYYVLWDSQASAESPLGEVAIQKLDGAGRVMQTVFLTKPFIGLYGSWFGRGRDGFDRIVFRNLTTGSQVTSYRATLDTSTSPASYQLSGTKSATAPSGYRALSSGWVVSTSHLLAGTYEQLLYAHNLSNGSAQLAWFTAPWTPLLSWLTGAPVVTSFNGGSGFTARAFVGNPPECQ